MFTEIPDFTNDIDVVTDDTIIINYTITTVLIIHQLYK